MRLIDVDVFIKDMGLDAENARKENLGEYVTMKDFDMQPTAYDVDKVVEKLALESERWKESGEAYEDQKELGVAEGFERAIEIVKSGGKG